MPEYRVLSQEVSSSSELEADWLDLQERSTCSYFQTWGWITTWLDQISMKYKPIILRVMHGSVLVGAGIFVSSSIKRRIFVKASAMFLNELPCNGNNMVIEYNGLVAAVGYEKPVYNEVVNYILDVYHEIDEFHFGAISEHENSDLLVDIALKKASWQVENVSPALHVDLQAIPPGLTGYLSTLSRNRRSQIRRSMRIFETSGPIEVVEAGNAYEAQQFLGGLKTLHTRRWEQVGSKGSFGNPKWEAFHRALIDARFDKGEIQLLKVHSGSNVIGYLYNLVWGKHIYVVQTGFVAVEDKRLIPGYVAHASGIAYNKGKGMLVYDFMHGDNLYKRILCNGEMRLMWVVLQRRRVKFAVEKTAVSVVRGLRKVVRKT